MTFNISKGTVAILLFLAKNEEYFTGGNTKPGDWYEDLDHDPDFQEEFIKV